LKKNSERDAPLNEYSNPNQLSFSGFETPLVEDYNFTLIFSWYQPIKFTLQPFPMDRSEHFQKRFLVEPS
jgi:hypothetical protein